jgi:quaternary ammonium compound-resistance protein SugE
MAWVFLIIAGIIEIGWAISLKYTEGFTRFWPSVGMLVAAIASFFFLSTAIKSIPVGTAYVVFTGIGAAGTVLFGIFFLGESRDMLRLGFITLIIIGTIGLKFAGEWKEILPLPLPQLWGWFITCVPSFWIAWPQVMARNPTEKAMASRKLLQKFRNKGSPQRALRQILVAQGLLSPLNHPAFSGDRAPDL